MIYEYFCTPCQLSFDVVKSHKEMERAETCEKCGEVAARQFLPRKLELSKTQVTHAEYNPAFGRVVKNKRHRDDLAKRIGVVEVGNDYKSGESMQDHYDKERTKKLEKRWEED